MILSRSKIKGQSCSQEEGSKILRFHRSERLMHWSIAIPFLCCFGTASILVFVYNPDPSRPYREIFSCIHKVSGLCLIVLPFLAAIICCRNYKVHFYNIKQAWVWTLADVKWLLLMGAATISSKIALPDQGKFNAAEKINFMVLLGTYPLYILTGLNVWLVQIESLHYFLFPPYILTVLNWWLNKVTFFSWIIHFIMALIATPLLFGHLFMALINPETRKALSGMITGYVDRTWAKHHYTRWFNKQFGESRKYK